MTGPGVQRRLLANGRSCKRGIDVRTTLLVVAALLALALLPSSASAAVCADYATQADAQAAADTRDSDGDGRYCVISPR